MSYDDVYNHLVTQSSDFPYSKEFVELYANKLSKYAEFLTVHDENKTLCGLVVYYANRVPNAYITHLWVNQSYRKKGICNNMLQTLHSWLCNRGFKTIKLEVRKDNEPAIRAYTRQRYEIVSTSDNSFIMEHKLIIKKR